jgi:tetratricopeptide (TPR) repeat protein
MAAGAATLVNPWGWGVYDVISRQEAALAAHSQLIQEWVPVPLDWAHIASGLSPFTPDMFYVLLAVVVLAVPLALARRRIGEAMLLGGAALFPLRHVRFAALFAMVVVVIGGAVLASCLPTLASKIRGARLRAILALAASALLVVMAAMRIRDLVTDRTYRMGSATDSFGTGLSWWFPEGAAAFVERENLPAQIFSAYNEGSYMAFRLGPKYKNYIDGRAIPFGSELMMRSGGLKASPPDAPAWKQEAERYGINTILIPMGRYVGLQFFPVLKQFCASDIWVPVYLDEVGAVFVRRSPETEALIGRFRVDCATAPLPAAAPVGNGTKAFNQWANAASVLKALGRHREALAAIRKALEIFPDNGYLHFTRGHIFEEAGDQTNAERDFLAATELEPNLVAPWSALAAYYQERGRLADAIRAWEKAARVSRSPWEPLQSLGYADLLARRPQQALAAFDDAARSLPEHSELIVDNTFLANIAHGRARSWYRLGNLPRAISYEEDAARLLPASADLWRQLAGLYAAAGRNEDAHRALAQASAIP